MSWDIKVAHQRKDEQMRALMHTNLPNSFSSVSYSAQMLRDVTVAHQRIDIRMHVLMHTDLPNSFSSVSYSAQMLWDVTVALESRYLNS